MQAWRSGLPQFLLLFFLQEQQPPELSPVAGEKERAPSSRYQSHLSWQRLSLLSLLAPCLPDLLYPSSAFAPSGGRNCLERNGAARTPCSCGRSVSGGSSSNNNRVERVGPSGRTGVGTGAAGRWWALEMRGNEPS